MIAVIVNHSILEIVCYAAIYIWNKNLIIMTGYKIIKKWFQNKRKILNRLWRNSKISFLELFKEKNYEGLLEEVIQSKFSIKKVIDKIITLLYLIYGLIEFLQVNHCLLWNGVPSTNEPSRTSWQEKCQKLLKHNKIVLTSGGL